MRSVLPQMDAESSNLGLQLTKPARIPSTTSFIMDPKEMSISQLLDVCRRTDSEAAWVEFLERIRPTIQGVAYKRARRQCSLDPGLIQELTQETLLKLFPALPKFEWMGEGRFFGWVATITIRAVEDWFRRQRPCEQFDEEMDPPDNRHSEKQTYLGLSSDEIEKCLKTLGTSGQDIAIFLLYYRYGYTAKEISKLPSLNLSEKQIETVIARLVRQLRREMG